MPTITVPFKTPLGQEELRTRAHKLGQRHRTLLFLIDGRRPLAEVLSLAHQAGAATSHFEDLLRMGLVELPPDPTPPAAYDIPTLTDEASLTSVDLVVVEAVVEHTDWTASGAAPLVNLPPAGSGLPAVANELPPDASELPQPPVELPPAVPAPDPAPVAAAPAPAVAAKPVRAAKSAKFRFKAGNLPVLKDVPEDPFERTIRQFPAYVPAVEPEAPFERTMRQFGPHATELPAVKPPVVRVESFKPRSSTKSHRVGLDEGMDTASTYRAQSSAQASASPRNDQTTDSLDVPLPLPDADEVQLLQQIRDLLADALRLDAPLFSARTFMRVRGAQSTGELINLVWEIEDHLSHKRRSRREMQSLQKARELLGLGNTLVAGDDSQPDYMDE